MTGFLDWLDYAEFYPHKGEKGYDGEHDGGVKGLTEDAPADVVRQFEAWKKAQKNGVIF